MTRGCLDRGGRHYDPRRRPAAERRCAEGRYVNFGSLFSGIGGFDLGLERTGMACRWQCEIDERASAVLAHHWPGVERYTDVRNIGAGLEPVDLICGGFPCQDVSVAGKRAGLAGERSGLWFEFHRVLAECKPGWVVIENVPGLLSSQHGRDFAVILRGLVGLGYGVAWRILDAQYFGLAQRRRRVFIVGHIGDGRAAEVLFEREGSSGDTPPSREAGTRVAASLTRGSSRSSNEPGRRSEDDVNLVAWDNGQGDPNADSDGTAFALNPQANQGVMIANPLPAHHGRNDPDFSTFITHTLRSEGADASEDGTGRGVPMTFQSRYYTRDNKTGGAPSDTAEISNTSKAGDSAPLVALQMNYIRKERIGDYAGTLAGQHGNAQFNGIWDRQNGVRRLMPVECERLQGFPDNWTDVPGTSDSARYRQLGNAVAVPCAEWIGRRIMACSPRLSGETKEETR